MNEVKGGETARTRRIIDPLTLHASIRVPAVSRSRYQARENGCRCMHRVAINNLGNPSKSQWYEWHMRYDDGSMQILGAQIIRSLLTVVNSARSHFE